MNPQARRAACRVCGPSIKVVPPETAGILIAHEGHL